MASLILKRASASRPSGEWNEDDFDVLADGAVVGRIFKANASPVGASWMWTLAFGRHEDRSPTHGYAATREGAMAALVKSWWRVRTFFCRAECPLSRAKRTWPKAGAMSAYDAVDGAHSAASRCHRVVASKRTT
jgi:hypothetical protein